MSSEFTFETFLHSFLEFHVTTSLKQFYSIKDFFNLTEYRGVIVKNSLLITHSGGRYENAKPYSMEYPMAYLKFSTPKTHVLVK